MRTTRKHAVGEVVIIGSYNLKILHWPLAVIEQLIGGRVGQMRVVRLRTSNGVFCRSFNECIHWRYNTVINRQCILIISKNYGIQNKIFSVIYFLKVFRTRILGTVKAENSSRKGQKWTCSEFAEKDGLVVF
ncbi:hypothetical protein PR048_009865 [Dryococelus australis]|uniref:DUF5641 domain-containing protein n=1 Tax=Dryococelus australis TaxID=614101 RepID=A0ABQ9I139_9NEOP|nr:hypothetical protein PR048_009865 [Dryococelus australis]